MVELLSSAGISFVAYLLVFGGAAVACLVSATRLTRVDDPDTRRGLVALLLTSSGWATAHVAFLLAPSASLKHAFYLIGLVVGLSAVGAWLYFCSAYTNRSLHRQPIYRRVATGVFLVIIAVKLTNPLHNLYFTTEFVTTPFPHLSVTHHLAHWLVMGLSYALSLVGYFMLLEHFTQVQYKTTPVLGLVGITGLPIVFDIIGFTTPYLIDITYEPVGVAIFAVGVAFVYLDTFQAIQLAGGHDEPVILVSADDRIRDYNDRATDLFPVLADKSALGEALWSILPTVTEALDRNRSIIERDRDGETRHYQVSESPFTARQADLGRLLVFADITNRERYRRELERQNERLEQFASMISHDLRNPLNVAMARVEMANDEYDDKNLATAENALDRMARLIEDVLELARHGQPIDDTELVSLSTIARQSWEMVDAPDAEIILEDDLTFTADAARLQQLFENLFRNAVDHGGSDVTIHVGALDESAGFYVADDGVGIPADERDDVFEIGYSTAQEGTGFGLAIVKEIVDAHEWEITLTDSESGGTRVEITGVHRTD